jgi:hypothetical protein
MSEVNNFKNYMYNTYKKISKKSIDKIFIDNNDDELKIFCNKYKILLTIYNENNEQLYSNNVNGSKTHKSLYLIINNGTYKICEKVSNKSINNTKVNSCISSYKKRDSDKNKNTVLFDDLLKNKENYKMYHIRFLNTYEFKYPYLIKKVNHKNIIDMTDEDINILKYLLSNFGLYVNLIHNDIEIDKQNIDETFLEKYNDYAFRNIFDKTDKYECKYSYSYSNSKHFGIFTGKSKEDIKNKLKKEHSVNIKFDIYERTEFQCLKIRDISDYNKLLNIIKDEDKLVLFKIKNFNEHLINLNYIDTSNIITADDINDLLENKICYMCNKNLDTSGKNVYTIDAINPLLGHVKNNCHLLCKSCNSCKGVRYIGKYSDKPYFYDINSSSTTELVKLLKYHNLKSSGKKSVLVNRLYTFLETI